MKQIIKFDNNSNIHRVFIQDSSSTVGAGLAGLTSASTGMIISTIANNEATATVYTVAASNVETITTLGTYAAPTASKCRFKEVDATNMPGVYELQFADARYSVASSNQLQVMISGATNAAPCLFEVQLDTNTAADIYTRVGAPAGASIAADLAVIDDFVDDLETRLTATRAGYLDNLSAGAVATQASVNTIDDFIDTEIGTIITNVAAVKADTAAILLDTGTDGVVVPQAQADKVWATTARTLTNIGIKKNTALANFEFMLVDSTDHVTPKTGVTVTATRSIDGAAFGACANAVTELSNGIYKISLAAADLNGDVVTLRFTGTAADDRLLTIITTA